jgi:putative membrane protein
MQTGILASIAVASALALTPALAVAASDKPSAGPAARPAPEKPGAAQQQISTEEYVAKAGAGDLFEVETGKLAAGKGTSGSLKQFGRMMVQAHSASADKVKQAAAKTMKDKVPAAKMNSHQLAMTKRLMDAEGREFDRLYIDAQIAAHREALQLHRGYAAGGADAELKKAAAEIAPIAEKHLAEARRLANTVTGRSN